MRVTFVDQVGATAGGAERTLATFLQFAPPDIEASAILFEDGAFADELRSLGVAVDIVAAPRAVESATREGNLLAVALRTPEMIRNVARVLRRRRPDLVYTNSMKAHFVGALAAKMTGTPCVVHFHDLFSGTPLVALRILSRYASQTRIACSQLVADAMDVGNTRVIYGPVQVDAYDELEDRATARRGLGIDDDLPIVALIGRINRWKGHDRFVRIAGLVNAVLPVRFIIVGAPIFRDVDFVPELQKEIGRLSLGDRVSFHPWVSDVRSVFAAIDINANCSTREPFGRTLVEAAAAGVPTVCFADSGASETIDDGVNGRSIAPGDEREFARSIVEMLVNKERLDTIARAARRISARFDAPLIAAEMADVIREAAAAA